MLKEYKKYLDILQNRLVQSGVDITLTDLHSVQDCVKAGDILDNVLCFYNILEANRDTEDLDYVIPLGETYRDLVRVENYKEYVEWVLPVYERLCGKREPTKDEEEYTELFDSIFSPASESMKKVLTARSNKILDKYKEDNEDKNKFESSDINDKVNKVSDSLAEKDKSTDEDNSNIEENTAENSGTDDEVKPIAQEDDEEPSDTGFELSDDQIKDLGDFSDEKVDGVSEEDESNGIDEDLTKNRQKDKIADNRLNEDEKDEEAEEDSDENLNESKQFDESANSHSNEDEEDDEQEDGESEDGKEDSEDVEGNYSVEDSLSYLDKMMQANNPTPADESDISSNSDEDDEEDGDIGNLFDDDETDLSYLDSKLLDSGNKEEEVKQEQDKDILDKVNADMNDMFTSIKQFGSDFINGRDRNKKK